MHNWDYKQLKRRNLNVIFATDRMILPPSNDIPVVRLGLHSNYLKRDTETLRRYFKVGKNHGRQDMAEDSDNAFCLAATTYGSPGLSAPVYHRLRQDLGPDWNKSEIGVQT